MKNRFRETVDLIWNNGGIFAMELTEKTLAVFLDQLALQERSTGTIQKYGRDLQKLRAFAGKQIEEKAALIAFKEHLLQQGYAPTSVNATLSAVNQYLKFMGFADWQLRFLKIQRQAFRDQEREMTGQEYQRLVDRAKHEGNERLALLVQTIGSTGIRVSELRGITVEAVRKGRAQIRLKGKTRLILLPRELCRQLLDYCRKRKIKSGPVFITRTGRPLHRSNIWRMLKKLALAAKVRAKKVFPHNLRHLFAVTYYKKYKDVVRLADILGHSSIDTTRIYTARSSEEQQRQIEDLHLVC